jgi:TetR/AcrR family transcriptional regulator, cholesterol catabolism regulator
MPRPSRRDKIVSAASTLFTQKGFRSTTVRDIAAKAGMNSGSLYAHFSSKEEILYEIMLAETQRIVAAVSEIVESDAEPEEKLVRALATHIEANASRRGTLRLHLLEWRELTGVRRARLIESRNVYEGLWDQIIEEGIDSGAFAVSDVKYARLLVLSAANWAPMWLNPKGPETPAEAAEHFAALLIAGFAAPSASSESRLVGATKSRRS